MVKPVGDVLNGLVDEVNRQFRHSETYHMPIDDPNKGATAMLVAR